MLEVADLTFDYPGRRALDCVSFALAPGSVTALIGPNGAGKSTLMRVIAALARPNAGKVRLAGLDVHANPRKAHELMGFLPDFFGLYNELSVEKSLLYRARAQNIAAGNVASSIKEAARQVGLEDRMKEKAGRLSRGLRQRLAIAQAIIHRPKFLILDEPASGLDPLARADLSRLLIDLREAGMTILVSSHILSELEDYSTDMLALEEGKIILHQPLKPLKDGDERIALIPLEIHFIQMPQGIEHKLGTYPFISDFKLADRRAILTMRGGEKERAQLLQGLVEAGYSISSFAPIHAGLQKAYLEKIKGRA